MMATFGDILNSLALTAGQTLRRKGDDTGFEAFTAAADNHTHSAPSGTIPIGGIIMWSGTVASIPANWALCDGNNSTPDLRDRFIVGAKQDDAGVAKTNVTGSLTQSGGSKDYTPAGTNTGTAIAAHSNHSHSVTSNVTTDAHTAHTHTVTAAGTVASIAASGTAAVKIGTSTASAAASGHTHGAPAFTGSEVTSGNPSASLTHAVTNNAVTSGNESAPLTHSVTTQPTFSGTQATVLPPYYALAFIMRTA